MRWTVDKGRGRARRGVSHFPPKFCLFCALEEQELLIHTTFGAHTHPLGLEQLLFIQRMHRCLVEVSWGKAFLCFLHLLSLLPRPPSLPLLPPQKTSSSKALATERALRNCLTLLLILVQERWWIPRRGFAPLWPYTGQL